jgi:hypothetical protein
VEQTGAFSVAMVELMALLDGAPTEEEYVEVVIRM